MTDSEEFAEETVGFTVIRPRFGNRRVKHKGQFRNSGRGSQRDGHWYDLEIERCRSCRPVCHARNTELPQCFLTIPRTGMLFLNWMQMMESRDRRPRRISTALVRYATDWGVSVSEKRVRKNWLSFMLLVLSVLGLF